MKQIRLGMGPPIWVVAQGAAWSLIGAVVVAAIFSGTSYGETASAKKAAKRVQPTQSPAVSVRAAEDRTSTNSSLQVFYVAFTTQDDKDDKKDDKKEITNGKGPVDLKDMTVEQLRDLSRGMKGAEDQEAKDLGMRGDWSRLKFVDKPAAGKPSITIWMNKGKKKEADDKKTYVDHLKEVMENRGVKGVTGKDAVKKAVTDWWKDRVILVLNAEEKDEPDPEPDPDKDKDKKTIPCPPNPCGPIIVIDPCASVTVPSETIVTGSSWSSYDACGSAGTSWSTPTMSYAPSYSEVPSYGSVPSGCSHSYSAPVAYSYSPAPSYAYSAPVTYSYAYAPSYSYSAPVTYSVPSYTYSAPVTYSYSAPVSYSYAPSYSYSAPVSYSYSAAPSYSYSAPVTYSYVVYP